MTLAARRTPAFRKSIVTLPDGRDLRFDSRYEANWARHLSREQEEGRVLAFIKNTTRFPLTREVEYRTKAGVESVSAWVPDFIVWTPEGCELHEVSGWQHNRKVVQISQFRLDYPGVPVVEVTKPDLLKVQRGRKPDGWEDIR